jgi:ATP-binding cassette subfamily C protein
MILEIFSIALVFPAIGFLLNEDISESNPFMKTDIAKFIFVTFRDYEIKSLIIFFLIFFGIAYFLKIIVTLFFGFRNSIFAYDVRTFFAVRLNHLYISQPYNFHLNSNSSKITNQLTHEINLIALGCNSLLVFILEFTVVVGLVSFFVIYQPLIMITIFAVMLPTIFIFRIIKKSVSEISKVRQFYDRKAMFLISQTFSGIKDLLIYNKSKIFSDQYVESVNKSSIANSKNSFIKLLPRNILELFLIVGIALICIYLPMEDANFKNELLKIMAAFAIASFRIMPALTRIIVSINSVNFMLPSLHSYDKLVKKLNKSKKKQIVRKKIDFKKIHIKNLTFQYNHGKKFIFKNFSTIINKDKKIGIIGESGSGKTTLINLFLGLLTPKKGKIELVDKKGKFLSDIKNLKISHVPQEVFLFDDTLKNNICIPGNDKINDELLKRVLKEADLDKFVKRLPNGLNTKVGERGVKISGGQKQRIGIARSLYYGTDILIFDEITSSLDNDSENRIIKVIEKINKTILLITHKKSNLKICDKIINLDNLN